MLRAHGVGTVLVTATILLVLGCTPDLSELTGGDHAGAAGSAGAGTSVDQVDGAAAPHEAGPAAEEASYDATQAIEASTPDAELVNEAADEAPSNAVDDGPSGNNLDASAQGDASFDGEGDGSSNELEGGSCSIWVGNFGGGCAQIGNPVQDDFTMETWVKPAAPSKRGPEWWYGTPLLWADVAGNANDFAVTIVNDRLAFSSGGGSLQSYDSPVIGSSPVPVGAWTHLCVTRTRATGVARLYVNGMPDGTVTSGNVASLNAATTMLIGNGISSPDGGFFGALRDLRFWNVVRTEEQIRGAMNATLTGKEAGLVAFYPFDEGQGALAKDRVGTNHAQLNETTTWDKVAVACGADEH